ncbi:MAG TPA: hypothetical protein VE338_13010 [Ktedonobacterales bacterium]|jgi:hypothetical protein|nr:hypothetical protein [Ktedonobacterales bacterium]
MSDIDANNANNADDALDAALLAWFEAEGLIRYSVVGDVTGEVEEQTRGPVVALGPGDDDFVSAPHPTVNGWPGRPLDEMTMDDYNVFMFRWFEAAVSAGCIRCAHCGKVILAGDDLPDPDTWDALFVEKELVAWMLAHFDCKRWLAKRLKGLQPFELSARPAPRFDLSTLTPAETERQTHVAELD